MRLYSWLVLLWWAVLTHWSTGAVTRLPIGLFALALSYLLWYESQATV